MLDRAADAAAARTAEAAAGGGDEAERGAQPAAAGIGEREHRMAGRDRVDDRGVPGDGGRVARVDRDHRDVEIGVGAGDRAERDLAVAAPDGDLVAAQHVRAGEDAARRR